MGRTIKRLPGWEYHLGCFLDEVKDRPRKLSFPVVSVNDWDCGHFVCEAILRMTGRPVITWARCYQSWRDLRELMVDPEKFSAYVREQMENIGAPEIPVEESTKGDLVILKESEKRRALSIRLGECCVSIGDKGLSFAPVKIGETAYRIGSWD